MFQLTTSLHYIFRTEQMGEWASFSTFAHHLGLSHAKLGVPRAIGWTDVCADCKCWGETGRPHTSQQIHQAYIMTEGPPICGWIRITHFGMASKLRW